MRRAERLFQIIQFLRSRRLTTANWLSLQLEVSERTIYRDIQDLMMSGVPITGEAGVGYVLDKNYNLPPLMFSEQEILSLVIGAKMATSLGGQIKINAEKALSKLYTALPSKQRQEIDKINVYAPNFNIVNVGALIECLNQAITQKRVVNIVYKKSNSDKSELRAIYPLGLFFWQDKWTTVGWCTKRDGFRHFRLDRITDYALLDEIFTLLPNQTLQEFFSQVIPNYKKS